MTALEFRRRDRAFGPWLFALLAVTFYAIDGALVHSPVFARRPDALTLAATVDLTLVVTLCYWLLVVRTGHARLRTVVPVFLASVATAALTLPPGHRQFVVYARYLALPAEIAIVALVVLGVRRAQRGWRAADTYLDVPERIRAAVEIAVIYPRVADIIATELSLIYYAFGSWRTTPFVPAGAKAFSYHRRNALAPILWTVFFASIVEMVAVHLLLRAIVPRVALVVLAISAFAAVWILGFLRAVQLRPIIVSDDTVEVRAGIHWSLDIPRGDIAQVEIGRVKAPPKRTPGYLRTIAVGQPTVLLTLRNPLVARGPYGVTRTVSLVSLVLDEPREFEDALTRDA